MQQDCQYLRSPKTVGRSDELHGFCRSNYESDLFHRQFFEHNNYEFLFRVLDRLQHYYLISDNRNFAIGAKHSFYQKYLLYNKYLPTSYLGAKPKEIFYEVLMDCGKKRNLDPFTGGLVQQSNRELCSVPLILQLCKDSISFGLNEDFLFVGHIPIASA